MAKLSTVEDFRLSVITKAGIHILSTLEELAAASPKDIVLTAGTNGTHSGPLDPHKLGNAFDLRLRDRTPDEQKTLVEEIAARLGSAFTCLLERPGATPQTTAVHCHIQVKKGTVYPPTVPSTPSA